MKKIIKQMTLVAAALILIMASTLGIMIGLAAKDFIGLCCMSAGAVAFFGAFEVFNILTNDKE